MPTPPNAPVAAGRDGSAGLSPAMRARYGIAPVARWKVVAASLVGAAVVGSAGYLGWQLVNPPVTWQVLAYDTTAADVVQLTLRVERPADRTAYCVLRAQDYNHHDVGYAVVSVPPGPARVQATYPLAVRAAATVGEVLGCALDAPPSRVPQPDFPPGTANPPQLPALGGT